MRLVEFIKNELYGWGKYERYIFPSILLFIVAVSFYLNDSKIALFSALCGIGYTILAGKGKISCYIVGLFGTFCYSYISFKNAFWGNLCLYMFYCMPMQILGIIHWKKNMNKSTHSIYKKTLSSREKFIYSSLSILLIFILAYVLMCFKDSNPYIDAFTTIFSILGLFLTLKRCVEQWPVWMAVNVLSVIMWVDAYLKGSNCFATIMMWATYLLLGIYFWYEWNKEINKNANNGC